jgi:gamma-glutamyltranspeptidase/glutathione hydrolase
MKILFSAIMVTLMLLSAPVRAQQASDEVVPETETSVGLKFEVLSPEVAASLAAKARGEPVLARDWMVAVANPHAATAGARVLKEGGTAADAMVAVQAVLGLVEPQSSGIGGGAFLVWFDATTGKLTTLDGRETAPMAVTPRLFQKANGERLKFWEAVVGGRSVGVPGTPALMESAHKKWGRKAWKDLFVEAIDLAESGFAVSPRLAALLANDANRLRQFSDTEAYFFRDGEPLPEGSRLTNLEYADVMRRMADEGARVIYSGDIAQAIVETVRGAKNNPGVITRMDLSTYKVKERPAVCVPFRGHQVCGMGPPSSGALTVGQILGLLDQFPVGF